MAGAQYERIESRKLDAETIIIPLVCGFIFGFTTLKGLVYLPSVIFGQFQWKIFLFIKFYLAAIIGSMATGIVMCVLETKWKDKFEVSRMIVSNSFGSVILGSIITGAGMAISGAESSLAFVQAGSGVWAGWWVIMGGMLGVLAYGFLYDSIFHKLDQHARTSKNTWDGVFNCQYWHAAAPILAGLIAVAYLMETAWTSNWKQEIPYGTKPNDSWLPLLSDQAWNPWYIGVLVGIMQIPFRAFLNCMFDSTYAYISTVVVPLAAICRAFKLNLPTWFNQHSSNAGLWGLFFFASAALGAYCSAVLGGMLSFERGFGPAWATAGGFLLVFGSLIAGACPTGMAVSGIADLNVMSYVATGVMLATAFCTVSLLNSNDYHPEATKAHLVAVFQ